jgi:hypothetical protein
VTFYYPKSEVIGILENISDEADNMIMQHEGLPQKLSHECASMVFNLVSFLMRWAPHLSHSSLEVTEQDASGIFSC